MSGGLQAVARVVFSLGCACAVACGGSATLAVARRAQPDSASHHDDDQDRILDVDDDCPNDPEIYNGFDDADGCPDRDKIYDDTELRIMDKVYFGADSAEILPDGYPFLDVLAAALIGNPVVTLVEIQGYADSRGGDHHDLELTEARAASVRRALIERGVDDSRLRSVGCGSCCPISRRDEARAWEANRRVEFRIIETTEGPHESPGCPAGREQVPK